ncbi:MAG: hypothetical protein AUJ49_01160 [Desulfovibrionaceae bacterium CG1_02_65_16]|nr:MAG: hypothetical protein AUJ49_01160 [Desulfovibrionaceae bacterium CG1_02_65_16]
MINPARRVAEPKLSIVFATRNRLRLLEETIAAVRGECAGISYEIVVVDGLSSDGSSEFLAAQPDVAHILEERLEGCCRAFDKGFRAARGELVCWINDDVALSPGCLARAVAYMDDPANAGVGIGALPLSTSAERQDVYVINCTGQPPVPYADMGVIRGEALRSVGYLTTAFRRFGWDPDLSLKVWAGGWRVGIVPGARVTHFFFDDDMRRTHEHLRDDDTHLLDARWEARMADLARQAWSPELVAGALPLLPPWNKAQVLAWLDRPGRAAAALNALDDPARALETLYNDALRLHREGDPATARKLYRVVERRADLSPGLCGWAHFKHGESLSGAAARREFARALAHNPGIAKARLRLAPDPLRVVFGGAELPGYTPLDFDLGDDELWGYYFDGRKAEAIAIVGAPALLDLPVQSVLANALRFLTPGSRLLVGPSGAGEGELHAAAPQDILRHARNYRGEFAHWRDALLVGWLLAKAPAGLNEREIEWPWVLERAAALPGRGRLLDVGSYATPLPGDLSALGFSTTALDINPPALPDPSGVEVVVGDIRGTLFDADSFDVITCVSTLEHIGVGLRYGETASDPDGDARAMDEIFRLLRPGGVAFVTVPCGAGDVLPVNKCYDSARLGALFAKFETASAEFRMAEPDGGWRAATAEEAGAAHWWLSPWYALGLFVLKKAP